MNADEPDRVGRDPAPTFRRTLLHTAQRTFGWTRLADAHARRSRTAAATVLMYHSVAPDRDRPFVAPRNHLDSTAFDRHLELLLRHRRVLAIDDLAETLRRRLPFPAAAVTLTFDDGYRDNLERVAPLLDRHGVPAVLYLATGYVERAETPWADELYSLIRLRRRDELRGLEPDPAAYDLRRAEGRERCYRTLGQRLLTARAAERRTLLDELRSRLGVEQRLPRLTLTFAEVRDLLRHHHRFELGVHTHDHLDLTAIPLAEARAEIEHCRDVFRRELGLEPRHFSFPYSRSNPDLVKLVADLGFETAVTGIGVLTPERSPADVPRIEAPRSLSHLRYLTSGAHPRLSLKLLGRA